MPKHVVIIVDEDADDDDDEEPEQDENEPDFSGNWMKQLLEGEGSSYDS